MLKSCCAFSRAS